MRPYQLTIGAGVEEQFYFGQGAEFIFLDVNATVNITVKDPDGNQEFYLEPGTPCRFAPFERLRISHDGASDTAFTLYIGGAAADASSAKVSGNIQPVGGSQNTANPPQIQGITDPLTPQTLDSHYGVSLGSALQTVVAPASNVNGIRIDSVIAGVNSDGHGRVMAKSAAPSAWNDANARILAWCYLNGSSGLVGQWARQGSFILPPGEGLYCQGNTATAGYISIAYKVL